MCVLLTLPSLLSLVPNACIKVCSYGYREEELVTKIVAGHPPSLLKRKKNNCDISGVARDGIGNLLVLLFVVIHLTGGRGV